MKSTKRAARGWSAGYAEAEIAREFIAIVRKAVAGL